jgi:hypothetical protein
MAVSSSRQFSPLIFARIASFTAIGIVLGLALSVIPNVELVTAVCFTAGFMLGSIAGVITGALTEALFAGFHPMGSTLGFVLIAQMIGMATAGLLGGFAAKACGSLRRGWFFFGILIGGAVISTLWFDLITNLAFPLMAGFSFSQTAVVLAAGIPFAVIHLISNIIVFLIVVAPLIPRLEKALGTP